MVVFALEAGAEIRSKCIQILFLQQTEGQLTTIDFYVHVVKHLDVNSAFYEGCDAGRFSAFIDEDLRMMPCSVMTNTDWYGNLKLESMLDIWQENIYFKKYRNNIFNNGCTSCSFQKTCMGGCPFIKELSQCGWKDERLGLSFPQT